jgi:hypothetical protein
MQLNVLSMSDITYDIVLGDIMYDTMYDIIYAVKLSERHLSMISYMLSQRL